MVRCSAIVRAFPGSNALSSSPVEQFHDAPQEFAATEHRGPHDASHGGVLRLRIARRATRDQDGDRIETLTTCGQMIQEAGVSLTAWSHMQRRPAEPPSPQINRRSGEQFD